MEKGDKMIEAYKPSELIGIFIRRGRFAITADDWGKRNEVDSQNINSIEENC